MEPRLDRNIARFLLLSVRAMHPREEKRMTNRLLISTAVAALIVGTGFANAQGTGNQGMSREAPAAGSTAQPSAPSSDRGGAASGTMHRDNSGASGMKGAESDTKAPDSSRTKASESNEKMPSSKSAQDTKSPAGEKSKSMSSETDTSKGAKDMKAEGRDSKSGMDSKSAQDKGAADSKSGSMNAQTKSPADSTKSQATDTNRQQTTTGNAATSATAAPPAEKRTQIVSAIKSETSIKETTNVNFNISVGARVPSSVHFYPLPPRIVEIYPEWRGYQVILVKGRYVIVRPETYEIVYVLEG
jgi:uncharacterized protein DUF1236